MDKIDPVPNEENWCRHLLTPAEVSEDDNGARLNPKVYENLLKRSSSNPKAISGRLLSLARGGIATGAQAVLERMKRQDWRFHGILYGNVGAIRGAAERSLDVAHAPIATDAAHANLTATGDLFEGGSLTPAAVEALLSCMDFIEESDARLQHIDIPVQAT